MMDRSLQQMNHPQLVLTHLQGELRSLASTKSFSDLASVTISSGYAKSSSLEVGLHFHLEPLGPIELPYQDTLNHQSQETSLHHPQLVDLNLFHYHRRAEDNAFKLYHCLLRTINAAN